MEYFTLNNGIKMPMAGIGVFMMSPAEAESAVESALKSGVRLIDTANGYMNEIALTAEEVISINEKLNHMEMSAVFGGSPVRK